MILNKILIAGILVTSMACSKGDDWNEKTLSASEIPSEIITYTNQHFAENDILVAVKEVALLETTYDLTLSGSIELEFSKDFAILAIDGVAKLPDSVIPQALLDYVAQNYQDNFITDWELESNYQQIELNNNLELEFKLNGDFIRVDHD